MSRILSLIFALALAFLVSLTPSAADGVKRAGLVVKHGDGRVVTRCIEFSEEYLSGEQLLRRSGLAVTLDFSMGFGAAVCKLDGEGSEYPAEPCFSKCLGQPCLYWHYFAWQPEGGWEYIPTGASSRLLRDGDADAWVWGGDQAAPPNITFDQICQKPATPTPSPPTPATGTPEATTLPLALAKPTLGPTKEARLEAAVLESPTPEAPLATVMETPVPKELGLAADEDSPAAGAFNYQNYLVFGLIALGLVGLLALVSGGRLVAPRYNTRTWLLWLAAALLPAMLTKNPFYLAILLLIAAIVYVRFRGQLGGISGWSLFLKLGLVVWAVTTLFNTFSVHYGETVLLTLPRFLPVIGGEITLEGLAFGFTYGMGLMAIITVLAAASAVIDPYQVVRLLPRFLYQASVVASIAIFFVPQTVRRLREIREAQLVRGHHLRGWRDLVPLFIPLLTSGLEKAIQLAESMECRGFGGGEPLMGERQALATRLAVVAGLLGLAVGLFLYFAQSRLAGLAAMALGMAILGWMLFWRSRGLPRRRYRHELWRRGDFAVLAACGLAVAAFLYVYGTEAVALVYYPYPQVHPPAFEPAVGGMLLLLVTPVLLRPRWVP